MQLLRNVFYSFPFQLGILHLRKFLFMLLPWLLLVLMITGNMGARLGLKYLFLDPEYLGHVNTVSFFIVGVFMGGFIFVWNITSYILNSFRFPFLATFKRPFIRYSLNNGFYPLVFVVIYFVALIQFQYYSELKSFLQVLGYQVALIGGMAVSLVITFLSSLNIHADEVIRQLKNKPIRRTRVMARYKIFRGQNRGSFSPEIRVDYVLIHPFKVRHVRDVKHYEADMLQRVFRLHHKNALIIECFAFLLLIVLGFFMEVRYFQVPSSASMFLLLGIMLAPIGALSYWLRSWAVTAFLGLVVLANLLVKFDFVNHHSEAYGLKYHTSKVPYNLESIRQTVSQQEYNEDKDSSLLMLNAWKQKVSQYYNAYQKPPLVLVNASGGGLKASVWSFRLMQLADSVTDDRFFNHCIFISGASGGMMGEAYYRELFLRKQLGDRINLQDSSYINKISKDLLNAVSFTYAVNDILLPWHKYKLNGETYHKDRGYMFEKRFNENTDFVFDRNMNEYKPFEREALIPMMLFSPVIIDDGRKLLLSAQPVSYLGVPEDYFGNKNPLKIDGIDAKDFFKDEGGNDIRFSSAIRMSSTFPYIMPNVYLPTQPAVQCMDAGLRDNYGMESAIRFLYVFRDWINENCSRVIIVQARGDYEKDYEPIVTEHPSLLKKIADPINSVYRNYADYEDYHQDEQISMAGSWLSIPFDVLPFEYIPEKKDQMASMSLHLTTREKKNVLSSFYNPSNKAQLNKLIALLSK